MDDARTFVARQPGGHPDRGHRDGAGRRFDRLHIERHPCTRRRHRPPPGRPRRHLSGRSLAQSRQGRRRRPALRLRHADEHLAHGNRPRHIARQLRRRLVALALRTRDQCPRRVAVAPVALGDRRKKLHRLVIPAPLHVPLPGRDLQPLHPFPVQVLRRPFPAIVDRQSARRGERQQQPPARLRPQLRLRTRLHDAHVDAPRVVRQPPVEEIIRLAQPIAHQLLRLRIRIGLARRGRLGFEPNPRRQNAEHDHPRGGAPRRTTKDTHGMTPFYPPSPACRSRARSVTRHRPRRTRPSVPGYRATPISAIITGRGFSIAFPSGVLPFCF